MFSPLCTLRITDDLISCFYISRTTERLRSQLILSNYFGYKKLRIPSVPCVCVSHVFLCVRFTKLECHLISKRFYCNMKMGWTTRMNFSQHYKMCTCMYLRIVQKVVVTALAQNTRTHIHLVLIMIFIRLSPYTLLIIRIQSCAFIIMVCTCAGLKMQCILRHAPHSTDTSQIPHTCNAKWNVSVWDADDIGRQTCRNNALSLKK